MSRPLANPVVHLELRTANLARACALYLELFDWRVEALPAGPGCYHAVALAHGIQGGVVERDGGAPLWLPYVEVADVTEATERARRLGAVVELAPREGPAGWRSVLWSEAGGEVALWQPKV